MKEIVLNKVRVHNLKDITVRLPTNQLIVFTGVSGSGKSSLAFDTLYMEGQRRYVESLSIFARRQMGDMTKPDIESAENISPTISIEQKTAGRNPRSTVGTLTEIYDYLRVLYARVGTPYCPVSGERVSPQSRERIIKMIQIIPAGQKIVILSPFARGKKGEYKEDFADFLRKGFTKARIDGKIESLEKEIELDKNVAHDIDIVIDRIVTGPTENSRIAEAVTQSLNLSQGLISVLNIDTNEETLFSMHAYSPKSGLSYPSLEPNDFSFNSPAGMCPTCHGLGVIQEFDLDLIIDPDLSIAEDCCMVGSSYQTVRYGNIYDNLARLYNFSVDTPWKKLTDKAKKVFLHGTDKKWTKMNFVHPDTLQQWTDHVMWKGVLHEARQRLHEAKSDSYKTRMSKLMHEEICPDCKGERLKPYPAACLFQGKRISEVSGMTIAEAARFFNHLKLTPQDEQIAAELLKEIRERLKFLNDVGLHYLTLDRTAPTLSGGEAQRVRLASQIGSGLVGITYVLDEPSIGLHPRDNKRLINTLKHLRDMGNTVVVVEHDEDTIWEADRVVDFGPGPGKFGGEIVVNGSLKDLLSSSQSLTGGYLSGRLTLPVPKKRRKAGKEKIKIIGASHHNLKNVDVEIPLGIFVAVTGVSGSGKSSLITDILYPALDNELHGAELKVGKHKEITGIDLIDKIITIDQTPIGRNPRSNPSTYIKLFDEIRDLFAKLPEAEARGFKPGRFSFNVKEGSCPECQGMGMIKVDMDFLEDAWIDCPTCLGQRFDSETLSILYKGKNIHDILEMDVETAYEFFQSIPPIKTKLDTLRKVGLNYIKLGQSSTTLSGGEAQRVKLAKELTRPSTGKTLYILDEPTTGLHFHDIKHLVEVLQDLVDRGNTVIVIEHNMDVVKMADWIIDLGPEGGSEGGQIVATGTPEKIAALDSPTGHSVKEILSDLLITRAKEALKKEPKKLQAATPVTSIKVTDAEQNNLKAINIEIPREETIVLTGPSGSGKSSLAFDTIYAEGQRRYIESMSPYARQFVKQMPKPIVGHVEGLSPAIAIEQKAHAGNPRSTVGTMTEIYDYLRLLYARLGIPHDPDTGEEIRSISREYVIDQIMSFDKGTKIQVLAPIEIKKNEKFEDVTNRLSRQGYVRIRLNGEDFELDQTIPFDRKRKNDLSLVIDRLVLNATVKGRLAEAVENAAKIGNNKLIVIKGDEEVSFNLSFTAVKTGKSYPEITPHTFAFNKAEGMCLECLGLGYQYGANLSSKGFILELSPLTLARILWEQDESGDAIHFFEKMLSKQGIDFIAPMRELSSKKLHWLLNGGPELFEHEGVFLRWIGFNTTLAKAGRRAKTEIKQGILPLLEERLCEACNGTRLNPYARSVTIDDESIADLCRMAVIETHTFIKKLKIEQKNKVLLEVKKNLLGRLDFLIEVGLHYLQLERKAPSLSGGEAQRIRLARQLGSGLTGVLYVLDEPTVGLHPHDNEKLNQALDKLKKLGNSLILVEHDPLTVKSADYIFDFGPASGEHGGHVTAQGTYSQLLKNPKSLTGAYLSGKKTIPLPSKRRPFKEGLKITNAKANNLKDFDVTIPHQALTVLTGVSGSGKSTLLHQIIETAVAKGLLRHESVTLPGGTVEGIDHFEKLIVIDQNPIGTTNRSDVSTYVDILTPLRDFFAQLPDARAKGLQPKHFSYNHRRGMCTACWGLGFKKVEMHFLPPVKVVCEECQGLRLNPISLEVKYGGKSLGEYLRYTVEEARQIFENFPRLVRILDTLINVGLGYLRLGQETASLSGGEAQRIKLSRELSKRSHGKTLYLLDEPTTGLHPDDIAKLMLVLNKLVDKGNTMIIIEHNLDVIKLADFVIDLGPEAGNKGGEIIAQGTPEEIVKNPKSITGKYLKPFV
jgi:excinuclease ABC subunit A